MMPTDIQSIAKDAHAVADDKGVWLFDEPVIEESFEEYVGPARVHWDEVPQLITWLVQQWAAHNAKERDND